MKKLLGLALCLVLLCCVLPVPAQADFQVTYYNEDIYAGGILDMMVFVGEEDLSGYTFQWQTDASLGKGSWYDLEDNASYKGTKTSHLQLYTAYGGDYTDWGEIPFRCVVTKNGVTKTTPNLYMHIRPTTDMWKGLENKGLGLYEPSLTNVTGFYQKDELSYTANAYAGSNIQITCGGSSESSITTLVNSDVQLKREIVITENGKSVVSGDKTAYIPYTIGSNAVKIEIRMRVVMAGVDRGVYQTKTVNITTKKPEITATGKTRSACSLLRYTYNESEKLASIPKGAALEVAGQSGSYYQVVYNGFVGYVGASLLDMDVGGSRIIDHVELTMAEPSAGNVAPTSITVRPTSCFATSVEWYDKAASRYLGSGDRFIKGHDYQLVVWVSAKEGYSFKLDSSDQLLTTAVLNGTLPCFTSKAYEQVVGKVIDIRYDFYNVQESEAPSQPQAPTTQPQHTHTPSAWRTTGAYHYKVCVTCGEFLEQEDHTGGKPTCSEKGKCTVCGCEYLETTEEHTPDTSKWVARVDMYHFHPCKHCGAHCDIEDHIPGPVSTPDDAVVCRDCGYILTPAKNHTHDLQKVPTVQATCTQSGNIEYYACTGCMDLFTDPQGKNKLPEDQSVELAPLGHKLSDTWEQDEHCHWRTCCVCGTVLEETKMVHDPDTGLCATCGYDRAAPTTEGTAPSQFPETTPVATQPTPSKGTEPVADNGISWLLLVVLAALGLGVGAGIVVINGKKKE